MTLYAIPAFQGLKEHNLAFQALRETAGGRRRRGRGEEGELLAVFPTLSLKAK